MKLSKGQAAEVREYQAEHAEFERLRAQAPETCALYEEMLAVTPPEGREARERFDMVLFSLGQAASLGRNLTQASREAVIALVAALKEGK